MSEPTCGTCGQREDFPANPRSELRPYGPGGAFICYGCAFSSEEAAEQAEANFHALSSAEQAATGANVIADRSQR